MVDLTPRQLEVLSLLVKGQGQTISKKTFFHKVWLDSHVDDGNLTQAIFLLRRALGRLPDGSEFIETVSGKGDRLSHSALQAGAKPRATKSVDREQSPASLSALDDAQYRRLIESVEEYSIVMLDPAGRVLTWNRGAEICKGFTSREVLGKHFSLFYTPEDIHLHLPHQHLLTATRQGRLAGEGWQMRKNGDRFWANFTLTTFRAPNGKLLGFARVVRDMTERKRQDDALLRIEVLLRQDHERLCAAYDSSMDAFFICDAVQDAEGKLEDFALTYLNRSCKELFVSPREEMLGGNLSHLLPKTNSLGSLSNYKDVFLTGVPFTAEASLSDRHVGWKWIRVQIVRTEAGVATSVSNISERKVTEEKLLHHANHDELTGLANRSLLADRIDQALKRARRNSSTFALAALDLDHFKRINDSFGHAVGDRVLVEVAARLQANLRASDSVSRIGGDEFAILMEDDEASVVATKLAAAMRAPILVDAHALRVTCSIGVAYYAGNGATVDRLLADADQAMYAVKVRGGDDFQVGLIEEEMMVRSPC